MAATFVKASTDMRNHKRAPVHYSLYEARRTEDAKHVSTESIVTMKEKFSHPKATPFSYLLHLFIYLGFYVAFNTVQVISRWVVGRAEDTSTYSLLGFCTVNCQPTASNYQLSHLRTCRESNPGLRGGRRECYHSPTMAPSYLLQTCQQEKVETPFGNVPCGSILSYQLKDHKPNFEFTYLLPDVVDPYKEQVQCINLPRSLSLVSLDAERSFIFENLVLLPNEAVKIVVDTIGQSAKYLWKQQREKQLMSQILERSCCERLHHHKHLSGIYLYQKTCQMFCQLVMNAKIKILREKRKFQE